MNLTHTEIILFALVIGICGVVIATFLSRRAMRSNDAQIWKRGFARMRLHELTRQVNR